MTVIMKPGETVFKATVKKTGGSKMIVFPHEVAKYLGLEYDDEVAIKIEHGKHGAYVGVGLLKVKDAIKIEDE